ncbi:membrane protein insertion efficiency factor YidD [Candidatus Uhrbacteria bacterium]|nr:membrane protein insertion efficiency factor YidD [Candidatus Uhrbacteria bacterium]
MQLPQRLAVGVISLYQRCISPDHSRVGRWVFPNGYCRYFPSCSAYARQAVTRYGVVRGALRGVWRVLRCNPWSHGGVDEP